MQRTSSPEEPASDTHLDSRPFHSRLRELWAKQRTPLESGCSGSSLGKERVNNEHSECSAETIAWVWIPKTMYELFFLREYLRARVRTPFVAFTSPSESFDAEFYLGCAPRWTLDHKTTHAKLTEQEFMAQARAVAKSEYLSFLSYEVNNKLLAFISESPLFESNILLSNATVMDGELHDYPDSTPSSRSPNGAFARWKELLHERTRLLVSDLQDVADGSAISEEYVTWPLRSPGFEEKLIARIVDDGSEDDDDKAKEIAGDEEFLDAKESVGESAEGICGMWRGDELENKIDQLRKEAEDVYRSYVREDIALLRDRVKKCKEGILAPTEVKECIERLLSGEFIMRRECNEMLGHNTKLDIISTYIFIVDALYPQLAEFVTPDEWTPHLLQRLRRHINPLLVIDPCVYCFTKRNFLEAGKRLISQVLDHEIGTPEDSECIFLYRGSTHPEKDGPTIDLASLPAASSEDAKAAASDWHPKWQQLRIKNNPSCAHSLSYGAGLFSGILQDITATPFNYMRKRQVQVAGGCSIMKLSLPEFADPAGLARRTIFLPPLHSLVQLASIGEFFHPRTKVHIAQACSEALVDQRRAFVSGILGCSYHALPEFLRTDAEAVTLFDVLRTQSARLHASARATE